MEPLLYHNLVTALETPDFTLLMSRLLRRWGLGHTEALVFAEMVKFGRMLTAEELRRVTGLARSTLSVVLRKLEDKGLVVTRKRGKKVLYRAVPRLHELFRSRARETLEREVIPLLELVRGEHSDLARALEEDLRRLKEKLDYLVREWPPDICSKNGSKG